MSLKFRGLNMTIEQNHFTDVEQLTRFSEWRKSWNQLHDYSDRVTACLKKNGLGDDMVELYRNEFLERANYYLENDPEYAPHYMELIVKVLSEPNEPRTDSTLD